MLTGVLVAVFDPQTISRTLGARSGWLGVIGASVVGAVTRLAVDIPGIVLIAGAPVSVLGPEETRRLSERLQQMEP